MGTNIIVSPSAVSTRKQYTTRYASSKRDNGRTWISSELYDSELVPPAKRWRVHLTAQRPPQSRGRTVADNFPALEISQPASSDVSSNSGYLTLICSCFATETRRSPKYAPHVLNTKVSNARCPTWNLQLKKLQYRRAGT